MDDFEIELKMGFLEEAAQGITDTEQCFLSLENDPSNPDTLNKIFRLAHNLKGSSKAVGFDQMGAFTHELETFILKIKNGELPASRNVISTLLACTDFVTQMISGLKENLQAQFDIQPFLDQIEKASIPETESAPNQSEEPEISTPPEEVSAEPAVDQLSSPEAVLATAEIQTELQSHQEPKPIMEIHENVVPLESKKESEKQAPLKATEAVGIKATNANPAKDDSIRVSVSRVENLLNFIGELVILQSVVKEQAMKTQSLEIKKTLHQMEKVTKEVQDVAMSLRMVPVKMTFQKMQRIVRDTALAVQKEVNLKIIGEETEVDKTVLEKINDPLVHLIRNSVDHGIETPETRKANGKNEKGNVTLAAYHKSGKLFIEVKDDGAGLDSEKLIRKAIDKKIIKPDTKLTEEQAYQLIFAPGFSTKEVVTDVSGRGVGMDVVKTNITDLQGEVLIHSKKGEGTTFQVILPLTLAIIEGMTVTYGEDRYVFPFNHVHETLRPSKTDIQENTSLGQTLMLRGDNMPIYKLGDFFGKKSSHKMDEMIALVIRTGPMPFAIWVDDILGQSQVVVKQLGSELNGFKGVSGCTILGDGKPALILEPTDLVKRKLTRSAA